MNTGPKIHKGSFYVASRLNVEIPTRGLDDETAIAWVERYQEQCRSEIALMPWWAWSRKRYLHQEILHGYGVIEALKRYGYGAVIRSMLAPVGVYI